MDFNAAIFDLDGTILDSMDVWEHIDIQFLKKRNLPVPDNYVTEICARSFEEAAQYTIDLFGLQETVEGIIEEWNNMAVEEYRVPDSGILQVRLNQRTGIYVYSSGRFFGDFTSSL